jgi:hypothetical protein
MANKIISDLELIAALTADKILPIEDASGTFAVSLEQILNFIKTNFPSSSETEAGKIEVATNAEVAAGSDTQRAVVPSALANLFGSSTLSETGQIIFPVKVSGALVKLIIKFGKLDNVALNQTWHTVTFAQAFPTAALFALCQIAISSFPSGVVSGVIRLDSLTTSQIQVGADFSDSAPSGDIYWFAIGY